jgi:hypothetical protein
MTAHKAPRQPNPGSTNYWLTTFEVGERRYVETSPETYQVDMSRLNTPPTRRPNTMATMEFTCSLIKAIDGFNVQPLIRVERTR